jgi:hypothetical protein
MGKSDLSKKYDELTADIEVAVRRCEKAHSDWVAADRDKKVLMAKRRLIWLEMIGGIQNPTPAE